jgi:hypothetical protein
MIHYIHAIIWKIVPILLCMVRDPNVKDCPLNNFFFLNIYTLQGKVLYLKEVFILHVIFHKNGLGRKRKVIVSHLSLTVSHLGLFTIFMIKCYIHWVRTRFLICKSSRICGTHIRVRGMYIVTLARTLTQAQPLLFQFIPYRTPYSLYL